MTQIAMVAVAVPTIIPTTAIVISMLLSDAKLEALSKRRDAKIDFVRGELNNKVDGLRADVRDDMSILDKIAHGHPGRMTRLQARSGGEPKA